MEMENKALNSKILDFLNQVISASSIHAQFLNTLSFLEYIGTRKIIKSQADKLFNGELLEHLNEEARHSLFFKKLAQKQAGCLLGFRPEEMLLKEESERYFQNIDRKAKECSSKPFMNYLYTTWTVEIRALNLYDLYEKVLSTKSFSFSLRSILKEEKEHLRYVEECGVNKNPSHKEILKTFEEKEFSHLLSCLDQEVLRKKQSTSPDPVL